MAGEHADSRDERIGRILNEYLDRQQRGEPVNERELLEANPDLADELQIHFGTVQQVIPMTSHGAQAEASTAALPHDSLPGYEILDEIHRGGQGVVYRALQKATRREVAVKVMREGPFAGWRDRARFDREVQVLGALRHPNIVAIHDSGEAAGCHYFVMDYIVGSPLNEWLTGGSRSIKQILLMFAAICDAVNAAHVKGIIHRDLKPGNIRIDDQGKPHILDFGLAKVAAHDDEDAALMTAVGQFVGSLPWTSPEQAQGMLDQIDTRTDVYALGVILYQMLTGQFPYEVVGAVRDVLNRIVTSEIAKPSTIRPEINRDVEAIVLKCLRKEPQRRYQTAGELSSDIERYLKGEPIAARSDSGLYVLGKMLRRYRVPVMVAAAFVMLIGVSLVASVSLWRQAAVQRDIADAKATEAEQARRTAEIERARTLEQAERLRRTTYLNRIALAQNACEQQYLAQAQYLLAACPLDLRGWEWHHLSRLARPPTILDIRVDAESVIATAISPDGTHIATGGHDGTIAIWNAATGAALTQLKGHSGQVNALAYSPDGEWIASGSSDKTLRLWNVRDGSPPIPNQPKTQATASNQPEAQARVLQQGKQYINCLAFSPDGKCLVAGGQGRNLTFWNVSSGQVMHATADPQGEISCVAFSPDGKQVVSGEFLDLFSTGGKIRTWDAATGRKTHEWTAHPAGILSVAFSPDGKRIASGSSIPPAGRDAQGTLKISNAATGEEILSLRGHEGFVESLKFSPDGKKLASAGTPRTPAVGMGPDRTLKVWNATTGAELCTYSAHNGGGRAVVWSPDGGRIYSVGMDGRLKAWPSSPPPEARVLRTYSGSVLCVAFSPDGKRLASCGGQGKGIRPEGKPSDAIVRVWDMETGSQLLTISGHTDTVLGLAWSPDGAYIAAGGVDQTIRIWDSRVGVQRFMFPSKDGIVQGVAFSPDGTQLVGVAGITATIWNVSDGKQLSQLRHADAIRSIAFSRDSRWMATACVEGEIRIWERKSAAQYRSISAAPGLNGAWFSPDSKQIATAHTNGSIALWDVSTGNQVASMTGPQHSTLWLDFSPDGQRIASCTTDMMLKIWDVVAASEVYSIRAHDGPVTCVRFSPDGRQIATASQDGLIKIWEGDSNPTGQ